VEKKNITRIGASVGLFSVLLSRALSEKYGNDIRIMISGIAVTIGIVIVSFLFFMKQYVTGVILAIMFLPVVIGFIGLYLDKSYLVNIGIILIFIIMPIIIKIAPKYRK